MINNSEVISLWHTVKHLLESSLDHYSKANVRTNIRFWNQRIQLKVHGHTTTLVRS
jgi:hypothetical protein